ncbi:hypothetical protein [Streptomyces zaehneri]|uniref:hypothetical protein n=1 Tax=Streptomyces zaehneri TaxID=3051180 RepID=UPI0037DA02C1
MEGQAIFGMLSVLAGPQRKLIVANTNDGLASARARGRSGSPSPVHSPPGQARPAALRRSGEDRPADRIPVRSALVLGLRTSRQEDCAPPAEIADPAR